MNPSRMLRKFTRAIEHIMRNTSASALISRLNTPTGSFCSSTTCSDDVHRQRRFAHARPRRDDNHFAAVQTVRHPVQIRKARRQARQRSLAAEKIFNRPDGLVDQILGRQHAALHARFAEIRNTSRSTSSSSASTSPS